MIIEQQPIDKHKYNDIIVGLSVDIYVGCQCGYRSTAQIVSYLNNRLNWGLSQTPSMGSIYNWVLKSGYSVYTERSLDYQEGDYAIITDESMMIGSEKMLLSIGVKAEKENQGALSYKEVSIQDISIERSWNSEKITGVLAGIEDKLGKAPTYVISDNASTIKKAVKTQEYTHIQDISHTLAMYLERMYKNNPSFKAYTKALSDVKFRENMRPASFLLPPKQRVIARFMNIAPCIEWSQKILKSFDLLSKSEQETFNFIKGHTEIIGELYEVTQACKDISNCLKNKGLSYSTIDECRKIIETMKTSNYIGVVKMANNIDEYLNELQNKLPKRNFNWHTSSDIIESLFGKYKSRKSCNPLDGVTRQVLILPLLTRMNPKTGMLDICYKNALEQNLLSDLKQWEKDNLTENLTVKRRKVLNAA